LWIGQLHTKRPRFIRFIRKLPAISEREFFLAALKIEDPRERALYPDRVCADNPVLRAKVEDLLKSHEEAGTFLDVAAVLDVDATVAQAKRSDPMAEAQAKWSDPTAEACDDKSATSPGESPELTQADVEVIEAYDPRLAANDPTIDGPGGSPDLPRSTSVRYFGDYVAGGTGGWRSRPVLDQCI
jgi:hypothetical protein